MPQQVTKPIDILQEIPDDAVGEFCNILKRDWPNSIHVSMTFSIEACCF